MRRLKFIPILFFLNVFVAPQVLSQHLEIDSLENLLNHKDDTVKVNILNRLSTLYRKVDADKSFAFADQAKTIAEEFFFEKGIYDSYRNKYYVFSSKGDLAQALEALRNTRAIATNMGNKRLLALSKTSMGNVYTFLNYLPEALKELSDAYKLYEEIGDKGKMANVLNGLGNVYNVGSNYEKAKEKYQAAIAIYRELEDESGIGIIYINMGEMMSKVGKYDESLKYYMDALAIKERLKEEETSAYILQQMASTYLDMKDFNKAQNFFEKALFLEEKFGSIRNRAGCLIGLGTVFIKTQRYAESVELFLRALEILKPVNSYSGMVKAYNGLIEAYENLGNYEKATVAQSMLTNSLDSLNAIKQKDKFAELEARYQTEANEQKIALLEKEQKSDKLMIGLLTGLIISGTAIVSLIIISLILRFKNHKAIAEKGRVQFDADRRARDLTEHQLRAEIGFKARELTSFTLNLIQKNEILDELKEQVGEIKKSLPEEERSKVNRIVNDIHLSQRMDKDWDNFRFYFEQVHQGFFDSLKVSYPELNQNDLKLCALLRLNLDTKKIATIMDISPESAKVARHRLRKKLGLQSDESLANFLNDLRSETDKIPYNN